MAVKAAEEAACKCMPLVEERQWPLHPAAAKVRVRSAVDQWEHDYDLGQVRPETLHYVILYFTLSKICLKRKSISLSLMISRKRASCEMSYMI